MTAVQTSAPGADARLSPIDRYQPGTCNIGPAEVRRRRRVGHVGAASALVLLALLVSMEAPPITRLLVALPATLSASGYLQARLKFCAAYGWRGAFNFGELGEDLAVADRAARAADQGRARQIGLLSLGTGLAVGLIAILLPI